MIFHFLVNKSEDLSREVAKKGLVNNRLDIIFANSIIL